MPINYKDYHKNWKQIVAHLKAQRGDRCELCYAKNGETVKRSDTWKHPWRDIHDQGNDIFFHGKRTKIVITTHHIDSDKKNNHPLNLILLCQKCHLRLDMQKHVKNRKGGVI